MGPATIASFRFGAENGAGLTRKLIAWSAEVGSQVSYEAPARRHNNTARHWHSLTAIGPPPAEPDYSVTVTAPGYSVDTGRGDLLVTVSITEGGGHAQAPIMDAQVSVELSPGLQEDPNGSGAFTGTKAGGQALILKSLDDLSWNDGIFYIGESLDGAEFRMTLPVRAASSASSGEPLCVTATITAQPPTGLGDYLDDPTDNVSKVCLGTAPAGEVEVLVSGTADLFTWYDCVGKSAPPCDRKDDGDATTNDDLQLVAFASTAAEDFGIVQPSQVVVHVPDPASRTNRGGGGLVWSTGFETFGNCENDSTTCLPGDVDRPGVIIARNTSWLDLESTIDDDRWGTPHTNTPFAAYETGYVMASASAPASGKMTIRRKRNSDSKRLLLWSTFADGVKHEATAEILARTTELGYSSADNGLMWAEFTTLGTYGLTIKVKADYETNVNDTSGGNNPTPPTNHEDEETYTFHVGPLADLTVADGGANSHVASDRNALTVVAANNGPDRAREARVTGLPKDAKVLRIGQGSYNGTTGVWNIGELRVRDYYRSAGRPDLTLTLAASGGETADVAIENVDNAYTVCIDDDGDTLAHTNHANCKADSDTTNVWHSAVCVKDSNGAVNTTATHDTQAECEAQTDPHTWSTDVCASDGGFQQAGRTETECDGWFQSTVYDPSGNNTAEITSVEGTGGVGPGVPSGPSGETGTSITVEWTGVEYLYANSVSHYEVQWSPTGTEGWLSLVDDLAHSRYVDTMVQPGETRYYRVRAVNEAEVEGPWSSVTPGVTAELSVTPPVVGRPEDTDPPPRNARPDPSDRDDDDGDAPETEFVSFPTSSSIREVVESAEPGSPVGAPVTVTFSPLNPVTYSLEGPDAHRFDIDPQTGQITVGDGTELVFGDGRTTFTVEVVASPKYGSPVRTTVTIVVTEDTDANILSGRVETVLGNLIDIGALDRVFRFDNETKEWQWYIADPAFASANNLRVLASGDLVWIKVVYAITMDILGEPVELTCVNTGTHDEDCWNFVAIP